MPLPILVPIILGGGSALAGALGLGAGAKGAIDLATAKKRGDDALANYERGKQRVLDHSEEVKRELEFFGKMKLDLYAGIIAEAADAVNRLKATSLRKLDDTELSEIRFSPAEIAEINDASLKAAEFLGGGLSSLGSGALSGFGAYGMALGFGAASTGTAISSLSGAAAQNALLAWFGGGSLASGGLGMAGGTAVLGAVAVGPALAIGGALLGTKGAKAKTAVAEYAAQIEVALAEMDVICDGLRALKKRIGEGEILLAELKKRLGPLVDDLKKVSLTEYRGLVKIKRTILRQDTMPYLEDEGIRKIMNVVSLVRTMRKVMEVDLFDETGTMTDTSRIVFETVRKEIGLHD